MRYDNDNNNNITTIVVIVMRLLRGSAFWDGPGIPPPPKLCQAVKLAATFRPINHIEQRAIRQRMAVAVIIPT